jgi:hypothetical protein
MVCLILDLPENGCKGTNNIGNTQMYSVKLTLICEYIESIRRKGAK